MAREVMSDKRNRAAEVLRRLEGAMPEAHIELDFERPLELLVCVILSAQTTDRRVNLVTPALFERYRSAADFAAATPKEIEHFIKTLGLFRNKAKSLVKLGKALEQLHGGEVPRTRKALAALPGVGPKTAGVVTIHLEGGEPAFPVDTHVQRLARRLGFSAKAKPDHVEADLQKLWPAERWAMGHQLLVWHGRRVCHARSPECHRCVVAELCPKRGVKQKKKG